MSQSPDVDFEKTDIILSQALEEFQSQGVNQYVYGMALIEIGVMALCKLEEGEDAILETVQEFINKSSGGSSDNPLVPKIRIPKPAN